MIPYDCQDSKPRNGGITLVVLYGQAIPSLHLENPDPAIKIPKERANSSLRATKLLNHCKCVRIEYEYEQLMSIRSEDALFQAVEYSLEHDRFPYQVNYEHPDQLLTL